MNNKSIKDLMQLGRSEQDLIIVDNSPASYRLQKDQGIPVSTWKGDKGDTTFLQLTPLLTELSKVNDCREAIKKFVTNNKVSYKYASSIITGIIAKQG